MGAPNLISDNLDCGLSYSVISYLKKLSQQVVLVKNKQTKILCPQQCISLFSSVIVIFPIKCVYISTLYGLVLMWFSMASSFTIKLQLRVCQYHLMLCHFSFCLPVCPTHKLVDILRPKRDRNLIELFHGSHFVYLQPSSFSNHIGVLHPPF